MALTTIASVRAQGGSAADEYPDAQIQAMIDGLSDLVIKTLHRDIELNTYTEYYSGNNEQILLLRQYPVVSVSRVCVDSDGYFGQSPDAFPASKNLVAGVDYALMAGFQGIGSSGALRRLGSIWYQRPIYYPGKVAMQPGGATGNILVTYTAGYATIPPGLVYAVNAVILKALANAALGGEAQSKSYEDASISYMSAADLTSVFGTIERTLGAYKAYVV